VWDVLIDLSNQRRIKTVLLVDGTGDLWYRRKQRFDRKKCKENLEDGMTAVKCKGWLNLFNNYGVVV